MKLLPSARFIPALIAVAAALVSEAALAGDPDLAGCWRGVTVIQYFVDGSKQSSSASRCTVQFQEAKIVNRCPTAKGEATIEYTYRISKPGAYVATISAHPNNPTLVGGTREYLYRVEANQLFITTYPQTTTPLPPTAAMRVESVSERSVCPEA